MIETPAESPEAALPRWDLTAIFPSLSSPEFQAAFTAVKDEIAVLLAVFDAGGVRRRSEGDADAELVEEFEQITARLNAFYRDVRVVGSYINCFVTTDANDELAQSLQSELRVAFVTLDKLWTRYIAWVGSTNLDALLAASDVAQGHEWMLRQAEQTARHQLSEAEEALASDLQPTGLSGWVRLHSDVSALLEVTVALPDGEQRLPMSSVRALSNEADRAVRRAAFEAELKAWEGVSVPLAAALNGVKGYQGTLRQRRGYADDVEPTLRQNSIDRATLDAMQAACVESFPDFRRYMHAKARALGVERLAWYDISAPVGGLNTVYSWPAAERFIEEQFGAYSPRMAEFAARTFRERWIDAEPRPGKEGGAYCTRVRPGESRVLMNFDGSFNSISTLAHELGHAYHNLNLAERATLQSRTPSTLAETASIFCETLVFDAVLKHAQGNERLGLLEVSLQRDLMVVVDIHSRFLFEQEVFARRPQRELTAREFSEVMLETQRATYGDGLDPELLHPYMWAVKGHYYGPTFYNYPYTFGLLFGLGLYARYQRDPEPFRTGYDELLSSTGLADAATLATRFGIDTRSIEFWRTSLDVIRGTISEFEAAVGETA
jgi:pepF/M3 family oligoendopeptidase